MNKNWTLNWSEVKSTVLAPPYYNWSNMIQENDITVFQIFDLEIYSIDVPRLLDKNFSFLLQKLEVSLVQLLLLGYLFGFFNHCSYHLGSSFRFRLGSNSWLHIKLFIFFWLSLAIAAAKVSHFYLRLNLFIDSLVLTLYLFIFHFIWKFILINFINW